MSRWPGRLITKTPIAPSGSSAFDSAPGVWTIPEVAYWTKQGLWPNAANVGDPYFKYVSFLLGTTATNAAQNNTFLDSSTNNFTITRNGNATQGSFTPYGSLWSNYFDGSGDYLSIANNAGFQFGTGDFTVECWVNKPAAANGSIVDVRSGGGAVPWAFYIDASNCPYFYDGSVYTSTVAISNNQWNHIAVVRTSGVLKIFVNGVQGYSQAYTASLNATGTLLIGGTAAYTTGYISNLRIVKGAAVYTGAFTPPAAPLTAISGTSLLTCQGNRFCDASSNNFAITRNGDVKVVPFSPFVLAPPGYNAADNGGSLYVDGNGDYLSLAGASAFSIATSSTPFTVEAWIYPTAAGGCIFSEQWTGSGNVAISIIMGDNVTAGGAEPNGLYPTLGYYNGAWALTKSSVPVPLNAWTHIAAVFTGSTSKIYHNGVDVTAASPITSWATAGNNGDGWYIGKRWDSPSGYPIYYNGYISGFRFTNGSAVYTSAFTPPTSPPTAISNTALLCNFTNAGIYDAALNNDMETVGSVQVSSAQAKFGSTSVAFNGNADYILMRSPASLAFGTGDFTVEGWFYVTSYASGPVFFDARPTSTNGAYPAIAIDPAGVMAYYVNGNYQIFGGTTVTLNAWHHFAVSRSGTSTKMFLDGVQQGSTYSDTNNYLLGSNRPIIGGNGYIPGGASGVNGYLDDLRVTKGYARYTSNFTPPAAPLPVY